MHDDKMSDLREKVKALPELRKVLKSLKGMDVDVSKEGQLILPYTSAPIRVTRAWNNKRIA